jgi:integrase
MKLTTKNVAKLQVLSGKTERRIFDDELRGFGVRLRLGGKRTWIAQYRIGTRQRIMTLGTLEQLNEGEARRRAKTALSKVHLGIDPQEQKDEARAQANVTLGSVTEQYLMRAERKLKLRSYDEVKRHLRVHWGPLAKVPLGKIGLADVAARLNAIAHDSGPIAANRARAALSALFSWAIGEGLAKSNPVVGSNRACDEIARDRVLSDEELRLIWWHAGEGDYSAIIRLLILTGQRREEVGGMAWGEIDLDKALWSIGGERTKNRRAHDVPLSDEAASIIKPLRREGRELVFGSREGPFQGWSNAKAALDARIAAALHEQRQEMAPWHMHDIRRTVATRMADLGVLPHVIEAVLNHVSGHKAGAAGVYNRASYAAEKRTALALWAEHLRALAGLSTNVLPLKRVG